MRRGLKVRSAEDLLKDAAALRRRVEELERRLQRLQDEQRRAERTLCELNAVLA